MNRPSSPSAPDDAGRQCSLLLVDDDDEFLEILERRFKRRGMSVATATSPENALETAGRKSFHVAVVDRSLGSVDGIDLMVRLRESQPKLQVILLSGHGDADAIELARSRGAFEYLVKPCALADLEAAVARAFAARLCWRTRTFSFDGALGHSIIKRPDALVPVLFISAESACRCASAAGGRSRGRAR